MEDATDGGRWRKGSRSQLLALSEQIPEQREEVTTNGAPWLLVGCALGWCVFLVVGAE
jgi:hypothetical protein